MSMQIIPSFLFYCYVSVITPGPANLCSLSAALQKGKKAALMQWTGLFTGFFLISMCAVFVSYFLGSALNKYTGYLSFVGAAYLTYLAIRSLLQTYTASERKSELEEGGFFKSFATGLLVQLTNVKVMVFCMTVLASYVLPYSRDFRHILLTGLFLPFTGPAANLVWLFAGLSLQRLFLNHRKLVSAVMAVSLLLCAVSLVLSGIRAIP